VALISVSLALSQTTVYTTRTQIQSWCITWCACLRPSFHWYSLHQPTERWPGWVDMVASIPACQRTVTNPSTK